MEALFLISCHYSLYLFIGSVKFLGGYLVIHQFALGTLGGGC
jgi:hypothetical protein